MDQPPQSWLGRNTITTKLVVIVLVFVLVFATVMGLFTCAYNVNAGIRAYVGGEGQWSKGQKDAVYHLSRYVISGDAGDYRDYQTAAALPLGDRKARVEMEKAQYDAAIVRQGFVEGGNAAEDVPQMIFLFRYLGSMPFFGQAIVIWRAAEQEFLQLLPLADEIRDARAQGPLSVSQQAEFLERIQIVNQRVTPLEQQFSQLLGAGAREVQALLLLITLATAGALLAIGLLVAWTISRDLRKSITGLRDGVLRVAMGVLTQPIPVRSADELGELGEAFNAMTAARRRSEAALLAANDFREKVMENASNAIYTMELEGRFTTANRRTCEITGYSIKELIGKPWASMVSAADLPALLDGFVSTIEGRAPLINRETMIQRPDGSAVSIVFSIAPLARDGAIFGVVGTAEDITVRKRAEQELQSRAEELTRSNRELEQFAYVASHDLQEPLRTVSGFAELLSRRYQGQMGEEADEYIGFITGGAKRMKSLIEDLLAYSRVQRLETRPPPTALDAALDSALANLRGAIDAARARIERKPLPVLPVDLRQFTQLFQNLIGNAIKFRDKAAPEIRIGAERFDEEWRITVRDNGIGIDAASAERVFMLFQRLHTRDEYEGNGIGLTICKKIVELHGGRIWAEPASEGGTGTVFCFTLPA